MKSNLVKLICSFFLAVLSVTNYSFAQTQCSDGIDNDGDGLVDAYGELPLFNGEIFTLTGVNGIGDSTRVAAVVASNIRQKGFAITPPTSPLVRSDGGSWDALGGDQGTGITLHTPTLQQVCRILGYRDYVSSTCRDSERSGKYPNGKCNYDTPTNNSMFRSNGATLVAESAEPKFQKTWISSITCQHRLSQCNDGWDNDQDGFTDLADSGCESSNDASELPDDPKCQTSAGTTEAEQCRNGLDDDGDGLRDNLDPGCWADGVNPATYNPSLDNEGLNKAQCQDGIDNDADGATDLADFSCSGALDNDETNPRSQCQDGLDNDGDGAADAADFSCQGNAQNNNEGTPKSQCQDGIDNDGDGAIDTADFSCQGNPQSNNESLPKSQCQDGLDNDGDGAADAADFSCQGNAQNNNESLPKSQCQDGVDNDGDGAADLADFGCQGNSQDNDEANPKTQCQDGIDNDADGAIDTADFSCSGGLDNDETNPKSQCQDGIDNDGDGAADSADFSCQGSAQNNNESLPKSQCQDGVDNDGDGAADLADFGCQGNSQDNDEANPKTQCQDGLDNDSDGAIDTADFSCSGASDNDETNPKSQCQDGIDNDGDGAADSADFSCQGSAQNNNESLPKSQCQDGVDNDGDGAADLADFGCQGNSQDNDEANPKTQCQDGLDNDSDGAIDTADFSCSGGLDNDETNPKSQCQDGIDNDSDGAADSADFSCQGNAQNNNESLPKSQCQDGVDNDGDGVTDLADFGCQGSSQDNDEGNPKAQCQDGIDNDGDGATDAADFSCQGNPQSNNEGSPKSQCQDGIDNDGDGAIDGADFSCQGNRQKNDEASPKSACQDGVDNDQDGLTDKADPGCSDGQDGSESDEPTALSVGGECVYDNLDGTFTAYFRYDNFSGRTLEAVNNPSVGSKNEFKPGFPDRGQITRFAQGRVRGAAAVLFDGNPITWTVRPVGAAESSATLSRSSLPCGRLEPFAECIDGSVEGTTVTFGYNNPNPFAVLLPVGVLNSFRPAPGDRGQPTTFGSGRNNAVFKVLNQTGLTWNLDGLFATVTKSTPICAGGCVDTPVGTIVTELDKAAIDLANLTKRAATLLAQRARQQAKAGQISSASAAQAGVDAQRAAKKADELLRQAQSLTLAFPDVIRTCPFTAPFCQTIDRKSTIDALSKLYAAQLNQLKRIMARRNFNNSGRTSRTDPLVLQGKRIREKGDVELAKVPRFATDCA